MILDNKLGITTQVELAKAEEKISKQKAKQLFDSGDIAKAEAGTFAGLAYIHHYLFSDIYGFAGQLRKVNIAKGNTAFARVMHLESNVANLKLSFSLVPNQLVRRKQPIQKPLPSLGDHIRTLRQQQGLKASELATKLGTAKSVLLRWETQATPPACSPATSELVKFLGFMPFPMVTTEEQLYAMRLINGWSQEQACQQFKCAPSTWSLLEQGKYTPTPSLQKQLTAFLQKHLVTRLKKLLPNTPPPNITPRIKPSKP